MTKNEAKELEPGTTVYLTPLGKKRGSCPYNKGVFMRYSKAFEKILVQAGKAPQGLYYPAAHWSTEK